MTTSERRHPWLRYTFGALITLAACGPIYDTQYRFTPPDSSGGLACTYQCENSKQQCRQLEEYRADDCTRRSEYEEQRCEAEIWRRKNREPKWYECGSSSCSADYERCETQYRACYQSCGGRVDAQTVCVANCDQIPPQPPPPPPPTGGKGYTKEDYRGTKPSKRSY